MNHYDYVLKGMYFDFFQTRFEFILIGSANFTPPPPNNKKWKLTIIIIMSWIKLDEGFI